MKFFTLKSGREVGVRRIDIVETGSGYSEGHPEYTIKRIMGNMMKLQISTDHTGL
jgi:hypothetical protein